jgi:hypothetical protein
MEDTGIFYDRLVKFPAIWYIYGTFGILCGHLVYFPRFGILYHEKSGNPALDYILQQSSITQLNKNGLYKRKRNAASVGGGGGGA